MYCTVDVFAAVAVNLLVHTEKHQYAFVIIAYNFYNVFNLKNLADSIH